MSMPGIGVRTGARILIDVGDGSVPDRRPPRAYAGLAPATAVRAPRSAANNRPDAETSSSNGPSSSPRSPPWPTRPPGPTTTRRSPRASTTPKPSSASPAAEPTSSSPCSATAPSTNPNPPHQLDQTHRGTPQVEWKAALGRSQRLDRGRYPDLFLYQLVQAGGRNADPFPPVGDCRVRRQRHRNPSGQADNSRQSRTNAMYLCPLL